MTIKSTFLATATSLMSLVASAQHVITFDEFPLPDTNMDYSMLVDEGDYTFVSGSPNNATFYGRKESWGGFSGFTYSNVKDSITVGSTNDRAAFPAKGVRGTEQYAVVYGSDFGAHFEIDDVPLGATGIGNILGMSVTNSTYAVRSMETGDAFSKKFGGEDGTDPDWFLLTIIGHNSHTGMSDSVNFYLADFRSDDADEDFIVKDWRYVDLSSMEGIDSLSFRLSSSDVGEFGMNTPAYFCLDEILIEVPSSIPQTNNELKVSLFPNPTNGDVYVQGASDNEYIATMVDVAGRLVLKCRIKDYISMANLPAGAYTIYLQDEKSGKNKVQKIIKQ